MCQTTHKTLDERSAKELFDYIEGISLYIDELTAECSDLKLKRSVLEVKLKETLKTFQNKDISISADTDETRKYLHPVETELNEIEESIADRSSKIEEFRTVQNNKLSENGISTDEKTDLNELKEIIYKLVKSQENIE